MQQIPLPTSVYTAVHSVIASQEHNALAEVDLMLRVLWTLAGIIREIPEAVDELIQLAHQVLACIAMPIGWLSFVLNTFPQDRLYAPAYMYMQSQLMECSGRLLVEDGLRRMTEAKSSTTPCPSADRAQQHGYVAAMEGHGFIMLARAASTVGTALAPSAASGARLPTAVSSYEQMRQSCQPLAAGARPQVMGRVHQLLQACGMSP